MKLFLRTIVLATVVSSCREPLEPNLDRLDALRSRPAGGSQATQIVDLGTLGGLESFAQAINDRGQVVGRSDVVLGVNFQDHGFLWQAGAMQDLGTLGGSRSAAVDINNRGQITGWNYTASGNTHAFLWQDGVMHDLGTLGGIESQVSVVGGRKINSRGQVVGTSTTGPVPGMPCCGPHAFLWSDGVMHDLGTLGGTQSVGVALNRHGQVVGNSRTSGGETHAFLWSKGELRDLGTLGGQYSLAWAINNAGHVVGSSETASGEIHPFLWKRDRMIDLGTLGGPVIFNDNELTINNRGQIAGTSMTSSGAQHAFLWENGAMHDLGTLGGGASIAHDMNDRGQVVGRSNESSASGFEDGFVWLHGVMVGLGGLGGNGAGAESINSRGQSVGSSAINMLGHRHAVLWSARPVRRW